MRAATFSALALLLIAFGCHKKSTTTGLEGPNLSGTFNVAEFILPAGTTKTITGPLTVNASGKIQIDGTLQVQSGANFAFYANGPFTFTGTIAPAPAASAKRAGSMSARTAQETVAPTPTNDIMSGADVSLAKTRSWRLSPLDARSAVSIVAAIEARRRPMLRRVPPT